MAFRGFIPGLPVPIPIPGGGGGGGSKQARFQADLARQREESIALLQQFLSQLVPGSPEYNQLASQGMAMIEGRTNTTGPNREEFLAQLTQLGQGVVSQQGSRIAAGGPATPFEARTDQAFKGYREANAPVPYEQDVWDALSGGQPIDTDSGRIMADIVARAQNPDAYYTSTLQQALDLAGQAVGRRAAQRGIVGSGMELEDYGRTGAELAIREAAQKEQFRQQGLANYGTVYDQGQNLRERQIGVERDLTNLQLGRESNLQGQVGSRTSTAEGRVAGVVGSQTDRAYGDVAYQEGLSQQREQALMSLLQEGGKLAATSMTGIPFSALPSGSPATFTPPSGSASPIGVDETLALQRAGYGGQMNVNKRRLADLLTRY